MTNFEDGSRPHQVSNNFMPPIPRTDSPASTIKKSQFQTDQFMDQMLDLNVKTVKNLMTNLEKTETILLGMIDGNKQKIEEQQEDLSDLSAKYIQLENQLQLVYHTVGSKKELAKSNLAMQSNFETNQAAYETLSLKYSDIMD